MSVLYEASGMLGQQSAVCGVNGVGILNSAMWGQWYGIFEVSEYLRSVLYFRSVVCEINGEVHQ